MRMTPQQAETVRMFTYRHFGKDPVVWLFGSRADDGKKGRDYDFLVETSLNPCLSGCHRFALRHSLMHRDDSTRIQKITINL